MLEDLKVLIVTFLCVMKYIGDLQQHQQAVQLDSCTSLQGQSTNLYKKEDQ